MSIWSDDDWEPNLMDDLIMAGIGLTVIVLFVALGSGGAR